VGPELAHLVDEDRVVPVNVDDDTALEAFHRLSQDEGVIPALETAHAFGFLEDAVLGDGDHDVGETVVVNVSGRGDKDLETVLEETEKRDLDVAPDMSILRSMGGGDL
jgi:tryptophan synthase beta chain